MLKLNKKLSVLLVTISISILSISIVNAKTSAIDVVGKDANIYEYQYDALKESAIDEAINGSTYPGASLYNDFMTRKTKIAAYYDDVNNHYVSFDTVAAAAVNAIQSGTSFDFKAFMESTSTPTITIIPNKVTSDSLGKILINGQTTVDMSSINCTNPIDSYSTTVTFKLNVTDPQDYNVTLKGVSAKLSSSTGLFGVIINGKVASTDLQSTDFVITKKDTSSTATISKINNISATVTQNNSYTLPTTVNAIMSDGSTESISVTWDNQVDTSQVGTFTFNGTVSGYNSNVILTLIVNGNNNSIVTFKDKNLEQAVRQQINKPFGDIYKNDVEKITYLNAKGKNIQDISGIENLINLQKLYLGPDIIGGGICYNCFNYISDIRPLSGLTNLQVLELCDNKIIDISALDNLTNLQDLELGDNIISNISALKGLTNLQQLDLSSNKISDINSLKELTNLQGLGLLFNQISDISALEGLTNLKQLVLSSNEINNINSLEALTNLQCLYLDENQISDISALKRLTNLQDLRLDSNKISDISALKELTNLQILYLFCNKISDISPLSGLTNLKTLWLSGNSISDYSPVKGYYNNLTNKDFELSKPKVISVTVIDNETIRVVFNEDVDRNYALNRSNYRLLDSKNVDITNHFNEIYSTKGVDYTGNSDSYYIKLKRYADDGTNEDWRLTDSKYTLTIKNIIDTSSIPNVMEPYTITFGDTDDVAPKGISICANLRSSSTGKDKVIVYFSEPMDTSTLTNKENYQFINGVGDAKSIPIDTNITVSEDAKSAIIEFPSSYHVKTTGKSILTDNENDVLSLIVANVKDKSGNTLEYVSYSNNYKINPDNTTTQNVTVDLSTLTCINPIGNSSTAVLFKLNITDPQDYSVTVKGVAATYNATTGLFSATVNSKITATDFTAADFTITNNK